MLNLWDSGRSTNKNNIMNICFRDFRISQNLNQDLTQKFADLFGNSIAVNVVKEVSENLIRFGLKKEKYSNKITVNSETIQKSLI